MRKEQLLNIYEDNGLYGAKDQNGQIVITDQYKKEKVIYYQTSLELSDLESNEVVWIGDKKLKKYIVK